MTSFFRVSGSGNDFLALVEPETLPEAERIAAWCRRGLSLGADGLFALRRQGPWVRTDHFNADGSVAELCINGTRCAARLAFHLGWCQGEARIHTASGVFLARARDGCRISLEVPPPAEPPVATLLEVDGETIEGWAVTIGVPHLVLPWPEPLSRAPVATLGAKLRHHLRFGENGTNVDFVRFPGPHKLYIRTFERGVEAETLACGTGIVAAAATGVFLNRLELPLTATTQGGFQLEITDELERSITRRWFLTGDARIVEHGQVFAEAELLPPGPPWEET